MSTAVESPVRFATISPAAFHIGIVLCSGPSHGYRIMTTVNSMAWGTTKLGPGTLYRVIGWMRESGMVEEVACDPQVDARRRTYALTPAGTEAIVAESRRLARLVRLAQQAGLDVD